MVWYGMIQYGMVWCWEQKKICKIVIGIAENAEYYADLKIAEKLQETLKVLSSEF
jgi:hypothetical protein